MIPKLPGAADVLKTSGDLRCLLGPIFIFSNGISQHVWAHSSGQGGSE